MNRIRLTLPGIDYSLLLLIAAISYNSCSKKEGTTTPPPPTGDKTFTNPITKGSDPWVYKKDSFYYYTHTLGNRIALWKTKAMSQIGNAISKEVFNPAGQTSNSENIWAPEIHFLNGKWYLYYTAGSGEDSTQRLWVLENDNADPSAGTWTDKGRIYNIDTDFWAIDGTVFEHNGVMYLLWSGRPNVSIQNQNIYISKMANPWTLEGPSVMLSEPELNWELFGPVNEGPEILKNPNGRIFLIYSASGCWTDDYALGMLSLKEGGDPLNQSDWAKNPQPVFTKKPENKAYAPGHNTFFKSQDGSEDWIVYHANTNSGDGCSDKRNVRMQKFTWKADGSVDFGQPITPGTLLKVPSGE